MPGGSSGCFLERRGHERTLRVRHERRDVVGHVGAKDVLETVGVDRQLGASAGQRPRLEEVPHCERREAALQVGDRLAHVGHESGDIHERGDLVRAARDRDHAAGIRVADEDDGAVELGDDGFEIGDVRSEAAQGKRSSKQRVIAAFEEVEDAVDENDDWLGHANSFRVRVKRRLCAESAFARRRSPPWLHWSDPRCRRPAAKPAWSLNGDAATAHT